MKIAVIGAGIIGMTTAYKLASDGHQVQVIEHRGAAAEESSFANAGIIATGYVTPWAAHGIPLKVCRHLFSKHSPVRLTLPLCGRDLQWMWQRYRACTLDRYLVNRRHMQRLALYICDRLHHITSLLNLNYERSAGCLILLRSEADNQQVQAGLNLLRETGVQFREINPAETRKIEPALHADNDFFGAIHRPEDEVGNWRQFAIQLKHETVKAGVNFSFNTAVSQIHANDGVKLAIAGEPRLRTYDACVVCAGADSAALLRQFGLNIRLAPVHGYSVSAPTQESMNAPKSAVMDERYKVAIARLGNHGSSGWALSCGSARVLADMIAGRVPVLDVSGFDLTRLQG